MKLQINKKVDDAKSAIFAVMDSLNFYVQPESLKELNVPKLADTIVSNTRKQYGEQFTKANLESVLNITIEEMTTSSKTTTERAAKQVVSKKEVQLTSADQKIVDDPSLSFNKKIAALPHLWSHQAVLSKAFGKSRQRVINAIGIAKDKQSK